MNALADPKVGKFINENFESSFQRVATFRIIGKQKQGGNVASYFCATDGRVLHVVPGPVNGDVLLREAKWVVDTCLAAMKEPKSDGASFKAFFRKAHAEKLRTDYGLAVQPVTYDPPVAQEDGPLTYKDPTGQPLAPKLPPSPIDGPDVKFEYMQAALAKSSAAAPGGAGLALLRDRAGRGWHLDQLGQARQLLTAHAMVKIEKIYGSVFEGILGEKITTKPVEVVTPFPWHGRTPNGGNPGILLPKGGKGGLQPDLLPPNGPGLFPGKLGG